MTIKEGSLLQTITDTVFMPLHPEGRPFVVIGIIIAIIGFLIWVPLGTLGVFFTVFCTFFFRDPARVTPAGEQFIIAPADGKIIAITPGCALPKELEAGNEENYTRISIFLSVLDVHGFRNPVSGTVLKTVYRAGKFFNAALDKASEDNERAAALIETAGGQKIGVVQIAGLVARRIVSDLEEGETIIAGARYGFIRFGSRADIYIPAGIAPLVIEGQRSIGGETILADFGVKSPGREGAIL